MVSTFYAPATPRSSLGCLLDGSLESMYWLGFLIADGHFGRKRMRVTLAKKDQKHLRKFANYIATPNWGSYKNAITVSCQDVYWVPIIRQRYSLVSNKTIQPPILPQISDDQFLCLFAGYLDGDGSIKISRGRRHIAFQIHGNWLETLRNWSSRLYSILEEHGNSPRINKRGYTYFVITNQSILFKFKCKLIEFKVPLLERKWDRILNEVPRSLKLNNREALIRANPDLNFVQLAKLCGEKYMTIYNFCERRGIRRVA